MVKHSVIFIFFTRLTIKIQPFTGWHKVREAGKGLPRQRRISSLAKTPNIRCFVANLHLSQFTRFFLFLPFDGSSKIFATAQSLEPIENNSYSTEQIGYRWNRIAIDRTEWLSIEQNSYRQKRFAIIMAIDRTEWLSI